MHLLIPFAVPHGPRCQAAIAQLKLPHLGAVLQRFSLTHEHQSNASDLTPLHERLALTLAGHPLQDGLTGQAARDALRLGLANPKLAHPAQGWAWITPCHWQIHADHVHMADPAALQLSAEESLALLHAMQGYFAEDGITLHPCSHSTWLAQGTVFCDLPTASLQRVVGASVDAWIHRQAQAKPLRRLQNEMQMLLYTHPLNDARAQRGLPVVNSFWVSGTGTPTATAEAASVLVCNSTLQAAARADDAAAWQTAWQQLDSTALRDCTALTLCGTNAAHTYAQEPQAWWQRLHKRFNATPAATHLQQLLAKNAAQP